ncbi:MAG: LacI family transcriptional regulator [Oscillospiraceae bacterium]|jgi:DNA-binding LacI/PurR family transcriptional regulator|nr:LacI family transcriptional regulator [Oscillospiraceae bacterium]
MAMTIYDLARAAGVSIATVSKALSDTYAVADDTKRRIRALAESMDYRPNARARSFARRANGTILFMTDLRRNVAFENPHMFEIITGAANYLARKGYTLALGGIAEQDAPAAIHEMILREQADGVILHAGILTKRLAALLSKAELPCLVAGKPGFPADVCWIDVNHELSGQLAVSHLLDRGYTRIAFLMGLEGEDNISESRLIGAQHALREEELQIEILHGQSTYAAGIAHTDALLARPDPPQAILCTNNYLALGCLQRIRQQHLRIPEDIALMTFDNYPLSMIVSPSITAVGLDMYEMGWEAARLMLRKIRQPSLRTQSYCTVPALLVREST